MKIVAPHINKIPPASCSKSCSVIFLTPRVTLTHSDLIFYAVLSLHTPVPSPPLSTSVASHLPTLFHSHLGSVVNKISISGKWISLLQRRAVRGAWENNHTERRVWGGNRDALSNSKLSQSLAQLSVYIWTVLLTVADAGGSRALLCLSVGRGWELDQLTDQKFKSIFSLFFVVETSWPHPALCHFKKYCSVNIRDSAIKQNIYLFREMKPNLCIPFFLQRYHDAAISFQALYLNNSCTDCKLILRRHSWFPWGSQYPPVWLRVALQRY